MRIASLSPLSSSHATFRAQQGTRPGTSPNEKQVSVAVSTLYVESRFESTEKIENYKYYSNVLLTISTLKAGDTPVL